MTVTATVGHITGPESRLVIHSLPDANIVGANVPVTFWIATGYLPNDVKAGDSVIVNMTFTKCNPTNNHQ